MTPADLPSLNAELHQRIQSLVDGNAVSSTVAPASPSGVSFVDLLERNFRAGLPLLTGAKAYRGSKDPDVDAGTFEIGAKHASPVFDLAVGYATTANHHMGLRCKATDGIGALAEYPLPPDAVFHRNFGIEDLAGEKSNVRPLSIQEAEEALAPMAAAYARVLDSDGPASGDALSARSAILDYAKKNLYEIALPAALAPSRTWVVVDNGLGGSRFIDFDPMSAGPLASVMVDVVKARKSTVDEQVANQTVAELARGGHAGFEEADAFSPGLANNLRKSAVAIEVVLADLRAGARATPLVSLPEALAWRKEAQRGVVLTRLSNSGSQVLHDSAELAPMPALLAALEDVGAACHHLGQQPQREAAFSALASAAEDSAILIERREQLESSTTRAQKAHQKLDARILAQNAAAERLAALEHAQQTKMSEGFVSRLAHRAFGGQKQAEAAIALQRRQVDKLDGAVERQSVRAGDAAKDQSTRNEEIGAIAKRLADNERRLRELRANGDLSFLPSDFLSTPMSPSADSWSSMNGIATKFSAKIEADLARGHSAANLFRSVAELGVAKGYSVSRPAPLLEKRKTSIGLPTAQETTPNAASSTTPLDESATNANAELSGAKNGVALDARLRDRRRALARLDHASGAPATPERGSALAF